MTEKQKEREKMMEFFLSIWEKRPHKSGVSGKYLGKEPSSAFFHHILSKKEHDYAKYDRQNIILLTIEEHDNVEMDMYRYEEINKRREQLINKYGII